MDTPGHADFGGEVERILSMVDGVVLLVDAAESVMPQTKFVLSKALKLGLKPIVVINKVDRPDAQAKETLESSSICSWRWKPTTTSSTSMCSTRRAGKAGRSPTLPMQGWIFASVCPNCRGCSQAEAAGQGGRRLPFAMLVTTLEADPYLGRVLTGRIESGAITVNRQIKALSREGKTVERARATKLLAFRGLARVPVERAEAGDIVAIAGLQTRPSPTRCATCRSKPRSTPRPSIRRRWR